MSAKSQMETLFAYHWHTTERMLACAARLDEAGYRQSPGYGHGSIHDLLFHLLRTDEGWRQALETGRQASSLQPEAFADLASLQVGFGQEQAAWQAFLDGIGDGNLEEDVHLTNWRGDALTMPLWRILQHLVLHGMQHHAELAEMLTLQGQSPGNIDFLFYR